MTGIILFVVGTNFLTFVITRHVCWQELKETGLLPFQVAILNNKAKSIDISCEVEESFKPKFDVLLRVVQRYHGERCKQSVEPPDSRD